MHKLIFCLIFLLVSLSGCTDLFFFPDSYLRMTPNEIGIKFDETQLQHETGAKVNGWYLHAEGEEKGTILFFHGNAQNISAHMASVSWLPAEGFNVFLLDYRGYGASDGDASVHNALEDVKLVIRSFQNERQPVIAYGQSIGASLLISALGEMPQQGNLACAILESPFASYQQIAREKLSLLWLTWPLQYPVSLLISDRYAPDRFVAKITGIPLLFLHSRADNTVYFHHSEELFKLANEPKQFWGVEDAEHIHIFDNPSARSRLLQYLLGIRPT